MIKNATIFKLSGVEADDSQIAEGLSARMFAPTGPTQEKSLGWVSPRGIEHSPLVERINGATLFKLKVETRKVPAATMAEEVAKVCKHIEASTGRKPGKKEKRDIKEEVKHTLLPKAFPKQATAMCILDGQFLIIDSASASMVDDVATALIKAVEGLRIEGIQDEDAVSPEAAMAQWLADNEAPSGFAILKSCELRATDESRAKVRYTNHAVLTEEVQAHLAQGKRPTSLAMEFDDRVQFTLTDSLQLKKISFGDKVMDQARENNRNPGDFDGSMTIAIGEMRPLLTELLIALEKQA